MISWSIKIVVVVAAQTSVIQQQLHCSWENCVPIVCLSDHLYLTITKRHRDYSAATAKSIRNISQEPNNFDLGYGDHIGPMCLRIIREFPVQCPVECP